MKPGFLPFAMMVLSACAGSSPPPMRIETPPAPSAEPSSEAPEVPVVRSPVSLRFEGQSAALLWLAPGDWVEIGRVFVPHDGRAVVNARWEAGALRIGGEARALGGEEGSRLLPALPDVRALSMAPWTRIGRLYADRAATSLDVGELSDIEGPISYPLGEVEALVTATELDPTALALFPRLDAFAFTGSLEPLGASAVGAIAAQSELEILQLGNVEVASIEPLAALRRLERLTLARVRVAGAPLGSQVDGVLRANPGLRIYEAPHSHVGMSTAELLAASRMLESVVLDGATLEPGAFQTIARNPALRSISAHQVSLSEADVVAMLEGGHVRAIDLRWASVPHAGLAHLGASAGLVWVGIGGEADDSLVAALLSLPSLASLAVGCGPITDAAILASSPASLEELSLGCAPITDAALERLATWPALVQLELTGTQVTEAGLARFRERRPEVVLDTTE